MWTSSESKSLVGKFTPSSLNSTFCRIISGDMLVPTTVGLGVRDTDETLSDYVAWDNGQAAPCQRRGPTDSGRELDSYTGRSQEGREGTNYRSSVSASA